VKRLRIMDILQDVSAIKDKGIKYINSDSDEVFVPYDEMHREVLGVLHYLQEKGLKKGDELIFQIEDNRTFVTTFWACIMGGIVPAIVSIVNNDELRMQLLRIWKTLEKPHLFASGKIFVNLEKCANDIGNLEFIELIKEIKTKSIFSEELKISDEAGTIYIPELSDTNLTLILL